MSPCRILIPVFQALDMGPLDPDDRFPRWWGVTFPPGKLAQQGEIHWFFDDDGWRRSSTTVYVNQLGLRVRARVAGAPSSGQIGCDRVKVADRPKGARGTGDRASVSVPRLQGDLDDLSGAERWDPRSPDQ